MSMVNSMSIKTSHYVIGAVGLVTALSWKETIKSIFSVYFPTANNILASFINAVVLTIILIMVINILPDTKPELPTQTQKAIELEEKEKKVEAWVKRVNYIQPLTRQRY